jgi:hypothetical protein
MIRMARPAHPGQFIRMEAIEPLDLSVIRAAEILGGGLRSPRCSMAAPRFRRTWRCGLKKLSARRWIRF